MQLVRGFRLYHELSIDYEVESLPAKLVAFVQHGDAEFPRHVVATKQQFGLEGTYVEMLEKSKSEIVVDLEEGPNHGMCQPCLE